jgi:chromosome segregation ATPase
MSTKSKLDNITLQIEYSKQEFKEITHMTHQSNCAILELLEIIERQNITIEILKGHVKTLESERLERERDFKRPRGEG